MPTRIARSCTQPPTVCTCTGLGRRKLNNNNNNLQIIAIIKLCNSVQTLCTHNRLYHSPDCPYGENLYYSNVVPADLNGQLVVQSWYDGNAHYKYDGCIDDKSGNFSQLVWNKSRNMGIGTAGNGKDGTFVVAVYDPPGNVIGEFEDNVRRPMRKAKKKKGAVENQPKETASETKKKGPPEKRAAETQATEEEKKSGGCCSIS